MLCMGKQTLSVVDGMMELMAILGEAELKSDVKETPKEEVKVEAPKKKEAPVEEVVYEHGMIIKRNGKSVTTGPKKGRGGSRAAKNDAGKIALKEVFEPALTGHAVYGAKAFQHSTEGLVIRMNESDYSVKITKAKTAKYDVEAADFEVEKDFSVRGKAKNSAPGIAKAILEALEASDVEFTLAVAKASGIVLHLTQGEYTIKISKKRDRVGFEAEKGSVY